MMDHDEFKTAMSGSLAAAQEARNGEPAPGAHVCQHPRWFIHAESMFKHITDFFSNGHTESVAKITAAEVVRVLREEGLVGTKKQQIIPGLLELSPASLRTIVIIVSIAVASVFQSCDRRAGAASTAVTNTAQADANLLLLGRLLQAVQPGLVSNVVGTVRIDQ